MLFFSFSVWLCEYMYWTLVFNCTCCTNAHTLVCKYRGWMLKFGVFSLCYSQHCILLQSLPINPQISVFVRQARQQAPVMFQSLKIQNLGCKYTQPCWASANCWESKFSSSYLYISTLTTKKSPRLSHF